MEDSVATNQTQPLVLFDQVLSATAALKYEFEVREDTE